MNIRGFSRLTAYNCTHCHLKCCATEYDLPLFPHESENLQRNYPYSSIFIRSTDEGEWLIRGDCCPFLTSKGLCFLHRTQYKPLICQTYPLIFWKIKPEIILSWIYPCRGNGFQWVTNSNQQITDQDLNDLIDKARDHFVNYWGDQIDHENPFSGVTYERIQQEINFFKKNVDHDLLAKITEVNESSSFSSFLYTSIDDLKPSVQDSDLKNVINAVLHWLSWSPVGLKLTFSNSKILFFVAAMWVNFLGSMTLFQIKSPLNRERYLQQLGSLLATSGMPLFWNQVEKNTQIESIRRFAIYASRVLSGQVPQDIINDFKEI